MIKETRLVRVLVATVMIGLPTLAAGVSATEVTSTSSVSPQTSPGSGQQAKTATVRVVAPEASVRLQADPAAQPIATVKAGTLLEVKFHEGDWYGVLLPADANGLRQYGFVAANQVEPVKFVAQAPQVATPRDLGPPREVPLQPRNVPAQSPDLRYIGREGLYLSLVVPYNRFPGGLRGDPVLTNGSDLLIAPWKPHDNVGAGVSFGSRSTNWAWEIAYLRSSHDTTFLVPEEAGGGTFVYGQYEGKAVFNRLSFDARRYWLSGHRIQPYFLIGGSLPWFRAKEAAFVNGAVGDANFFGLGADVGAGVSVWAYSGLSASIGPVYNYDIYLSAKGGSGDWETLKDTLTHSGIKVVGTITYVF